MKLRYFYKVNHLKQPIPGSNLRRKSKPGKQWVEILKPCCSPQDIPCTCGPRFFIQIDGLGNPVDGTLIKKNLFPKMEDGIHYQELQWKSPCCTGDCLFVDILSEQLPGILPKTSLSISFCGATTVASGERPHLMEFLANALNENKPSYLTGTFTFNEEDRTLTYTGNICEICEDMSFAFSLNF